MTVFDDINERGAFWWRIHELNWLPVPDWTFLLFLILAAIVLVAGGAGLVFARERERDRDFEERAERLGYMKRGTHTSGPDEDTAP